MCTKQPAVPYYWALSAVFVDVSERRGAEAAVDALSGLIVRRFAEE
jgi:hypothetical protein